MGIFLNYGRWGSECAFLVPKTLLQKNKKIF